MNAATRLLVLILATCGLAIFAVMADDEAPPLEAYPSFVLPDGILRVTFEFPLERLLPVHELEALWLKTEERDDVAMDEWEHLAMQWFAHNRFAAVVETYHRAKQTATTDLPANMLWVTALSHEALLDWTSALAIWSQLHQRQPSNPLPVVRMAVSLLQTGHGGEALAVLRQGTLRFPDQPVLHHLLATCHWLKGEPRHAWRALARASGSQGVSRETLLFLAWVTLQDGSPEEAVGWLRQAFSRTTELSTVAQRELEAFSLIHEHPAYLQLFEELDLTVADMDDASPSGEGEARVEVVPAEASQLPESLQISIRLQDAADQEVDDTLSTPWDPDEISAGVQLRSGEGAARPTYILLHDMPEEGGQEREAGWWAVQDSNL